MEFFATADIRMHAPDLQRHVRINNLPEWCASISQVLESQGEKGNIYSVWGEFRVHREVIRDGVRFTLPSCPNALQWTVTVEGGAPAGKVVVHCTINRAEHAPDLIDSIRQFVADWKAGLEGGAACMHTKAKPPGECMPWYG